MARKKRTCIIRVIAEFEFDLNEVSMEYLMETKQTERLIKGEEIFFPGEKEIEALLSGQAIAIKSGAFENRWGDIVEAHIISPQRERLNEKAPN
jgi:hypothetical protein